MKFSLTIHDLTEDQVDGVLTAIKAPTIQELKTESAPIANIAPSDASVFEANTSDVPAVPLPESNLPIPSHFADHPVEEVSDIVETELDASGIPWDERIHAGSKKMTAKGFWKKKRNIDEAEYDRISAELQSSTPVPDIPTPAEVTVAAAVNEGLVPAAPVAAPVAAVVPPAPIPAAPAPVARDYAGLMIQIQQDFTAGTIDAQYANTIVDRINAGFKTNVTTLPDIADNAEMVDYAWKCVDVDVQARAA